MKSQMKSADRSGASVALIVGDDELGAGEVTLRPLRDHDATGGEQRRVRRDDLVAELRALHAHPEVLAVGECGLDYFRDLAPRPAQRRAFEQQLQLAAELGKPLFLHQRDAHADFMGLMKGFEGHIGPAVVHCFTGTREELFDCLDADFYIGITGWLCDERRGGHLRDIVRNIPADRLMIETDAPYLLPRTVRPTPSHRRNEPMYLKHIVEELARDRGETPEQTAAISTATSRSFFGLPVPA